MTFRSMDRCRRRPDQYSCIVIRMDYRDTSFLFAADIVWAAESAMMNLGFDLTLIFCSSPSRCGLRTSTES